MSLDHCCTDDKSSLVQVMAWCHLTTSHYNVVQNLCRLMALLDHSELTVQSQWNTVFKQEGCFLCYSWYCYYNNRQWGLLMGSRYINKYETRMTHKHISFKIRNIYVFCWGKVNHKMWLCSSNFANLQFSMHLSLFPFIQIQVVWLTCVSKIRHSLVLLWWC